MSFSLRSAKESDLEWIEEVRRAAYLDLFVATWGGWDEEKHKRHFAAFLEAGPVSIIEASGRDIGVLQLAESVERLEVEEIQILPGYQNQGFGGKVLEAVIEQARSSGKDVYLSLGLKNESAYRLYKRLGFEEYKARSETHIFMRADVGSR